MGSLRSSAAARWRAWCGFQGDQGRPGTCMTGIWPPDSRRFLTRWTVTRPQPASDAMARLPRAGSASSACSARCPAPGLIREGLASPAAICGPRPEDAGPVVLPLAVLDGQRAARAGQLDLVRRLGVAGRDAGGRLGGGWRGVVVIRLDEHPGSQPVYQPAAHAAIVHLGTPRLAHR